MNALPHPVLDLIFEDLRTRLERLRDEWQGPTDLEYRGPADFVLREGVEYRDLTLQPRPVGAPSACYGNAIRFAVVNGWSYVEGYAMSTREPAEAFHHAWNLDAHGQVVETTWTFPSFAYLGVEFSVGRADDATWHGDASVLDDLNRGWPLLRERWQGENPECVWAKTDLLRTWEIVRDEGEAAARAHYERLRASGAFDGL